MELHHPRNQSDRLGRSVRSLKGVGPKTADILARRNLHCLEDLLYFLPIRYEDRRRPTPLNCLRPGPRQTVVGKVVNLGIPSAGYRRSFELTLGDSGGILKARWFRGRLAYLQRIFRIGTRVILNGDVHGFGAHLEMVHPDFEVLDGNSDVATLHFHRIVPIYSEPDGLNQKIIRRIMKGLIDEYADDLTSPIPDGICTRRHLLDMATAIRHCHFPTNDADVAGLNAMRFPARDRLVFDEFFFFYLGIALRRRELRSFQGHAFQTGGESIKRFMASLPFRTTAAQDRVWSEIVRDLSRPIPMNRLLQGDVGSGKTILAVAAMILAVQNGYQAALMAPTEILAEQHHRNIHERLNPFGLRVGLLTGSSTTRERQALYGGLQQGEVSIVVGTHALIQESMSFERLGLVVIDEQHRFGVLQRTALRRKGASPHVLVMTATPIPRTLAMTLYGDLDVSVLDELPPDKKAIRTRILTEAQRSTTYRIIRDELLQGHKVFIVYPLVEESEGPELKSATRMADHLTRDVFPDQTIGLLHGRMNRSEKETAMRRFLSGEILILVATSVIEVGIDVPEASLMVIEHAERFGLTQLHQLRGRVGRSPIPSQCILMLGNGATETAAERLRVMSDTNDGFRIAEADLEARGPGEFLGTRQSGLPVFRVADIVRDGAILQGAREEAFRLVDEDPFLTQPRHRTLRRFLLHRWGGKLELAHTP